MSAATVIHRIADSCRQYPENVAVNTPAGEYTYRELAARVRGLQTTLRARGLPSNRLVGVLTGDDPLCYAAILAILACGCAYVPLNHRNPSDRQRLILDDAGIDVVVAHRANASLENALADRPSVSLLRSDQSDVEAGDIEVAPIDDQDLAYLFYTSGSTGAPKGVPIHHYNLEAYMRVMLDSEQYSLSAEDRFLQMFELTFDLSVTSFLTPLCIGAGSYAIAEQGVTSVNVIQALQKHSITVALMVPSVLFYLQRYFDEIRLQSMRYSLFCGEALPQSIVEKWAQCVPNANIQNLYGPTEATIACLRYEWEPVHSAMEAENGVVAIGTPFPGMHAFVLDEAGRIAPPGQRGELCLDGDQVTDRYWNNPERSEAAFFTPAGSAGTAYRTGDLCFVNERGNFVYCGRKDYQIKIDGYRVELGEIEHFAREASGVNAAVVATAASDGGVALTLFLEDPPVAPNSVSARLQDKLPPHMLPHRTVPLDALPLNANGKIDRPALATLVSDA